MRQLMIKPVLYTYDNCMAFINEFAIGKGDLILTNKSIFKPYFGEMDIQADVLYQEKYGVGDPSDEMAEAIFADMTRSYKRIVAIGGGAVLDLAKIYALKNMSPVLDLFDRKLEIQKDKELILVPTTCGAGSEVTNISVLKLKTRGTHMCLALEELYADSAVMIPQLLEGLPYPAFASGSIDALVHAVESYVSPRATPYTRLFAEKAITLILDGYRIIAKDGEIARVPLLSSFLRASNYAGISFCNAGAGAVHAMADPLCEACRIPHGEAANLLFLRVFEAYMAKSNGGAIARVNKILADSLRCDVKDVYKSLEKLLGKVLRRTPLKKYGVVEEDLSVFVDRALRDQGGFMADNFVPLTVDEVASIYRSAL